MTNVSTHQHMETDRGAALVKRMLADGFEIYFCNGILWLRSPDGKCTSADWRDRDHMDICEAISKRIPLNTFRYLEYTVGRYNHGRAPGVCLQFEDVCDSSSAYTIFNAALDRTRNTKHGKAGTPLPPGQFRVGPRSSLVKFWKKTGLPLPRRLSALYDYMGHLSQFIFTGERTSADRLDKNLVEPLNLSPEKIHDAFRHAHVPDISRTIPRQATDNVRTIFPDKGFDKTEYNQLVTATQSTGAEYCGNTAKEIAEKRVTPISSKSRTMGRTIDPQSQTNEEWLEEYSRAEMKTRPP